MKLIFNLDYYASIYEQDEDELIESFNKLSDYRYFRSGDASITKENTNLYNLVQIVKEQMSIVQKSGYFLGYKIEKKIDEQFDLLRFSKRSILNIELKDRLPKKGWEGVEDQLRRHKFVLSILDKKIISYVYIDEFKKIYQLSDSNELIEATFEDFIASIEDDYIRQNEMEEVNTSDFIISPYTETVEFANHEYYLTQSQGDIKRSILCSSNKRIVIHGEAGTGKTLMLFDLAVEYHQEGKSVLILFCGNLTESNEMSTILGFDVKPIKNFELYINDADVVFIDESQRLYDNQLIFLDENFEDKLIYFSYDERQQVSRNDKNNKELSKRIADNTYEIHTLKNNIRSNRQLIAFIERLLKLNVNNQENYIYENIDVTYFQTNEQAVDYIDFLKIYGYESIELTEYITRTTNVKKRPKINEESREVHGVIGREYEKVVIILDKHFYYNENSELDSNYLDYYPYLEKEGIYQALTRAKEYLHVIVIDNPDVYKKIQGIFTKKLKL